MQARGSFTTIKNHNTLKRGQEERQIHIRFTTIKNHNTLKQGGEAEMMPEGFTTIKNHNTLKRWTRIYMHW